MCLTMGIRRPVVAEHPSDAKDTDCHVASLLAMTVVFVLFRSKSGAVSNEKYVIANQSEDWCGNPFPTLRSNVSAPRADNVTKLNNNLAAR